MRLGKSQREKDITRVASIALVSREDRLLFGKRRDSGKWTLPGGHLEGKEEPLKGALRELLEETGLKPDPGSVEYLGSAEIPGKNLIVYSFCARYLGTQKPSSKDDPDEECEEFRWCPKGELPKPLHNAEDVTLQLLGEQKRTLDLEPADDDLDKTVLDPNAGYRFEHKRLPCGFSGNSRFRVSAFSPKGDKVGEAVLWAEVGASPRFVHPDTIRVDPDHRRRGVASAMYAHIERATGLKVKPVGPQTTDGRALWAGNAQQKQFGKSEPLNKMALKDIERGKLVDTKEQADLAGNPKTVRTWDYSHVLNPQHRKDGYSISVEETKAHPKGMLPYYRMTAYLHHPSSLEHVGHIEGSISGRRDAMIGESEINKEHRGKGLGLALYEAFYRHAMELGATHALGGEHSTSAGGVHSALSEKHGMNYEPEGDGSYTDESGQRYYADGHKAPPLGSDFDGAHSGYNYKLKSELPMTKSDLLSKDMGSALSALAIGAAMSGQPNMPQVEQPQAQIQKVSPKWSPQGLHRELHPIAQLESNFGQQMDHYKSPKGSFDTAYGAVGLKPMTAHEEYLRQPMVQKKYPGLTDPADFEAKFKSDPSFYNAIASSHWQWLRSLTPTPARAAYSWRFGLTAQQKASDDEVNNTEYVKKFLDMLNKDQPAPVQKSEKTKVPDLKPHLTDDLRGAQYQGAKNPLTGHCYVASEALYHHLGGAQSGWVPQYVAHEGAPHWYLKHKVTGEILDPTARQFKTKVPYGQGIGKGFLTAQPSRRAQVVLQRLREAASPQRDYVSKAETPVKTPCWKSRDGISIPVRGTTARRDWDKRFRGALVDAFGGGDATRLRSVKVKLGPAVSGSNLAMNKDRLDLYRKMARKDKLPPIVVRRSGQGFNVIDGNHRHVAAEEAKLSHLDAYEILDSPMKKGCAEDGELFLDEIKDVLVGELDGFKVYRVHGDVVRNKIDVDFTNGGNPERYKYVPEDEIWVEGSNDQDRISTALHEYVEATIMSGGVGYDAAHDRAAKIEKKFRQTGRTELWEVERWLEENGDFTKSEIEAAWALRIQADEIGSWLSGLRKSGAEGNSDIEGLEGADSVAMDMLGNNPRLLATFEAARFLTGGKELSQAEIRSALYEHDDDCEIAALHAYGLPEDESGLRALRACIDLGSMKKAEEEPVAGGQDIKPGVPEAGSTADEVSRAFRAGEVNNVKLGGKHSKGTMIARDPETQSVWLLKPGSGRQSPAAGAREEPASQSRREACFWHVAEAWALENCLPHADLLVIDGREVAAMRLLPFSYQNLDKKAQKDPGLPARALEKYRQTGLLHKWSIIDFVLGNTDRHLDNLMISKDNSVIVLIDHGSAFAGPDFDPANDKNSFVPGYLRAWGPTRFNCLSTKEKMDRMPEVSDPVRKELMQWLDQIHADRLESILNRYGIDPRPTLVRLAKVKMMASQMPVDRAINKLWIET